jgi:hypothetical protein
MTKTIVILKPMASSTGLTLRNKNVFAELDKSGEF